MRITQLTRTFNLFLLARLFQFLASPAAAAAARVQPLHPQLLPSRSHTHQKRLSHGLEHLEDTYDTPADGQDDAGDEAARTLHSCKNNPNHAATKIAQNAAHEAETAYSNQQSAAAEVAQMVKQMLADKAMAAAKAAEAVLSGKQQIMDQLDEQRAEAQAVLQQQINSVACSQHTLNAAKLSARNAQQVILALEKTLKIALENMKQANEAVRRAQQDVEEKIQLVAANRKRLEMLRAQQLDVSRELKNIKQAAYKALHAASAARIKARGRRKTTGNSRQGRGGRIIANNNCSEKA